MTPFLQKLEPIDYTLKAIKEGEKVEEDKELPEAAELPDALDWLSDALDPSVWMPSPESGVKPIKVDLIWHKLGTSRRQEDSDELLDAAKYLWKPVYRDVVVPKTYEHYELILRNGYI